MYGLTTNERVAIVLVPRDRFSIFPKCLESLYCYTDVPFRIIVVAGDMDKTTQNYLSQLRLQKHNIDVVLMNRLLQQGEARNIGLRRANERFCVILENDTMPHANWLGPMLECMLEEKAAIVSPLLFWYRGIHAAGGMFEERDGGNGILFRHRIIYSEVRRRQIDYPECHCILIDRQLLSANDIFDDVEPFDVDLGLTLREHGLRVFLEPRSVATYSPPPPCEIGDVPLYKFRWAPELWEARNIQFMKKWRVTYDPSAKLASYRRQQVKLGLARLYPNRITLGMSNVAVGLLNRLWAAFAKASGR